MRRYICISIAIVCIAAALLTGCGQSAPVSASASAPSSASASVQASAATPSATPSVQPTVAPSASPAASEAPSAPASASASASADQPYEVAVPYDIEQEKNSQKSVDDGHSPWRLDAIATVQSFVSIKMSPNGEVVGDFPIKEGDLKIIQSDDSNAVVAVSNEKSPISNVYLKRLVRPGEGGIWTVVGYDPK